MEGDIIPKRKIFGKLLFLLILTMGGVVYILLTFNKFLIEVGFFDDWFLYVILIFLLVTLIFLWIHMGLHVKIVYMISPMKEFYKKRKSILEEEKNKRLQEKVRKKAEKLKLQEEERRKKEESIKEKKLGIFSKLFKKKIQEDKPKKEKIPLAKELSKNLKIDIGKYETDIDVLYKIIERIGRIKLSAIAKYFGVDQKKVEEWAQILHEHELVDIYYPPIGEPELRRCKK